MKINEIENEGLIFEFPSKLDTDYSFKIEEELFDKINTTKQPIVFDFINVEYICSAFLRICLRSGKHAGQERFSIINAGPTIFKVFQISGFDSILNIKEK